MPPIKLEESDASMRARLVESLSHSFPGSALSKALHGMLPTDSDMEDSDSDLDFKDQLSSSCFSEIRLDKVKLEAFEEEDEEDCELTSLSWLQDGDLLKNIATDRVLCASPLEDTKENTDTGYTNGVSNAHPPHVPYNPQKHVNSKPPYSFSCLIFMAIEDSPQRRLPVKDIYNWILTHFPYFQNAPTGWKNSVRHNLSLNKCFKKVEKERGQGLGKGSLWCIDPDFRPNLLQALRKTPYHPYHQLQMLSMPNTQCYTVHGVVPGRSLPLSPQLNVNTPSPHLFPFLSRRLAQSKHEVPDDVDVANTLVALKRAAESRRPLSCKNGQRSRSPSPPEFGSEQEKKQLLKKKLHSSQSRSPQVITVTPSEDHTYSVTEAQLLTKDQQQQQPDQGSPRSSIDEAYDFGSGCDEEEDMNTDASAESDFEDGESLSSGQLGASHGSTGLSAPFRLRLRMRTPPPVTDEEEKRKIEEGADALLNLARIFTSQGPIKQEAEEVMDNNNGAVKEEGVSEMDQS